MIYIPYKKQKNVYPVNKIVVRNHTEVSMTFAHRTDGTVSTNTVPMMNIPGNMYYFKSFGG